MVVRPKIGRNEWNAAESGAVDVGRAARVRRRPGDPRRGPRDVLLQVAEVRPGRRQGARLRRAPRPPRRRDELPHAPRARGGVAAPRRGPRRRGRRRRLRRLPAAQRLALPRRRDGHGHRRRRGPVPALRLQRAHVRRVPRRPGRRRALREERAVREPLPRRRPRQAHHVRADAPGPRRRRGAAPREARRGGGRVRGVPAPRRAELKSSTCASSNGSDQPLRPCFEKSTGAIDSSENQPNRLREFQGLVGTSQLTG